MAITPSRYGRPCPDLRFERSSCHLSVVLTRQGERSWVPRLGPQLTFKILNFAEHHTSMRFVIGGDLCCPLQAGISPIPLLEKYCGHSTSHSYQCSLSSGAQTRVELSPRSPRKSIIVIEYLQRKSLGQPLLVDIY